MCLRNIKTILLGNVKLIEKFVELNFCKIIKSNIVRRYGIKLFDLGCNFFGYVRDEIIKFTLKGSKSLIILISSKLVYHKITFVVSIILIIL